MAQSSAATTSEADQKAQSSAGKTLANSWNPDDFSIPQLLSMEPWMISSDEHTITLSHRLDPEKGAIRRVTYLRTSLSPKCHLTRWRSVVHSVARRKLFE